MIAANDRTLSQMMLVSTVICTWNRAALLRQTFEGMLRADGFERPDVEILVVNNNCTDDTDQVIAEFKGRLPLRRAFEPAPGQSNARNRGVDEARGDYLLWTDDDVLVEPQWLTAFRNAIARYPNANIFGGPIDPWFPGPVDPDLTAAYPVVETGFCGLDYRCAEGPLPPGRPVVGANMGFRRAALANFRFDPNIGVSPTSEVRGEEVKLIQELTRQGNDIIWVPEMRVRHYVEPSRTTIPYLIRFYEGRGRQYVRVDGAQVPEGPMLARVPRWLWRELVEALFNAAMARITGASLAVKRRLRSGPPPARGSSRRVKVLAWMREYHWLRGAISEFRRRTRSELC